jgi:hypothetical protein
VTRVNDSSRPSCHPPTRDDASWLRARFTPLARRLDHVAGRYGHTARTVVPFLAKRVSVSPREFRQLCRRIVLRVETPVSMTALPLADHRSASR